MKVVLFCAVFAISLVLPIVASLTNLPPYGVIGYADVSIALVLLILAIAIHVNRPRRRRKGSRKLTVDIYKILFSIPLLLLGVFFLGLHIKWEILLVGLAWRFWLLSFALEDLLQTYKKTNTLHAPQEYK